MENKNLILSLLLIIICKFGFPQMVRLESVSYSYVQVVNNEVLLNYGAPTTMRVSVMLSKPVQNPWGSLPVKGEVKLFYYKNNQEINIVDPITFSGADWSLPTFSNFIVKDITIPANTVTITNPKIDVIAKWRYYKEGYPHPDNNNGWTDWYNGGYTNFVLNNSTLPEATFTGPSQICDEGTYTITNPGTITLENAAGAATLTALGNNQWKVTRTTQFAKNVILRSTSNGKVYDYPIKVGADKHAGSFMKPPMIGAGVYTIRFNDSQNDFDMNSITWSVRSTTNNVSLKNNTGNIVNVEVLNWNNSGQNNIILTFNAISSCGEAITRDIAIGPGSDIFNPDA